MIGRCKARFVLAHPFVALTLVAMVICTPAYAFSDHMQLLRDEHPRSIPAYAKALKTSLPGAMGDYHIPGSAIAIVENGYVKILQTYGEASPGIPVTADTVFGVASISKMVTAWGVMHLVDLGKMDLNQPLSKYLSTEQRNQLLFDTSTLTIRQLLSHTTGLSDRSGKDYWPPQQIPPLIDELSAKLRSGKPVLRFTAKPGTSWAYSTGAYGLLQLAIENASGLPFARYMQEQVFKPLGMSHSFFGNPELTPGRVAVHFDETGAPIVRAGYANLAGAALYTTIGDFSKFGLADTNDSTHGVLKSGDLPLMKASAPGTNGTFGLGYFIETLADGEKLVGHDGSDVGWNAMYRSIPSKRAAFIMLTSSSTGVAAYAPALCAWLRYSANTERPDYCTPLATAVIAALYHDGSDRAEQVNAALSKTYGSAYGFSQEYWNFIAYSMQERGQARDALTLFQFLATLYPQSANAFDNLGDGYRAVGDNANAEESYRKALTLNPDLQSSKDSLQTLTKK